jgi:N-acylethanolamine-hydrolysing acid amidase
LTGHKKDAFTFTIDERDQGSWWINFLFAIVDKKATPIPFITRRVFENGSDFETAVKMFSSTDLIAPAYFILGGVKPFEGAVITRSQNTAIDIWRLNATSKGIESWYLLETNYDHWLPPPDSDDRRTPGMKAMNATGQVNLNPTTLLNVLSIDPVCNK